MKMKHSATRRLSKEARRDALYRAVSRIKNGHPKIVDKLKAGASIEMSAVAAEAAVDRSLIYKYYRDVLDYVAQLNDRTLRRRVRIKQDEVSKLQAKNREYLDEVREATRQRNLALDENYRLILVIKKLEEDHTKELQRKDQLIRDLTQQLNMQPTALTKSSGLVSPQGLAIEDLSSSSGGVKSGNKHYRDD